MSQAKSDVFVCPGCGEQLSVSPEMRTAVIKNSCPVCATAVEKGDFE